MMLILPLWPSALHRPCHGASSGHARNRRELTKSHTARCIIISNKQTTANTRQQESIVKPSTPLFVKQARLPLSMFLRAAWLSDAKAAKRRQRKRNREVAKPGVGHLQ